MKSLRSSQITVAQRNIQKFGVKEQQFLKEILHDATFARPVLHRLRMLLFDIKEDCLLAWSLIITPELSHGRAARRIVRKGLRSFPLPALQRDLQKLSPADQYLLKRIMGDVTFEGPLPPGALLRRLAERVFTPVTYIFVLEPTLSDLVEEHTHALDDERPWKARLVRLRGYWSFWKAVATHLLAALGRRLSRF